MSRLEDFREMINGVSDSQVLESGQTLLREMIEINDLKRRLEELETNLTKGGKAIFYFFAEELDEDELIFATERISGRITRLQRSEKIKEKSAKESNIVEDSNNSENIECDEESNSI